MSESAPAMADVATPAQPADAPAAAPATPIAAAVEAAAPIEEVGAKRKADTSGDAGGRSSFGGGGGGERGRGSKRGRGGRGRGGGGGGFGRNFSEAEEGAQVDTGAPAAPAAPLTPIQQQFQLFAGYLDARNDRREAVYQSSRDLTRASKKLITQLQRCTHATPAERSRQLASARSQQLTELHHMLAATIADFTEDEYYRYSGAYSPGFQEFIESASFLYYLEHGTLLTHRELESEIEQTVGKHITIPLSDYVVGILDLGGELMRYATNSVTTGNRMVVLDICAFLRGVYAEYQRLASVLTGPGMGGGAFKELPKKMEVWMQSLVKIETLAYKLHIRGAEISDAKMLSAMLAHEMSGGGGGGGGGGYDGGDDAGGGDD